MNKPYSQLYAWFPLSLESNTALFDPINIAIETFSADDNFTHEMKSY